MKNMIHPRAHSIPIQSISIHSIPCHVIYKAPNLSSTQLKGGIVTLAQVFKNIG